MIKITIAEGFWEQESYKRTLHWEACPNPKCKVGELHYPSYMLEPKCPECQTVLPGAEAKLTDSSFKRMAYHKEA